VGVAPVVRAGMVVAAAGLGHRMIAIPSGCGTERPAGVEGLSSDRSISPRHGAVLKVVLRSEMVLVLCSRCGWRVDGTRTEFRGSLSMPLHAQKGQVCTAKPM
jgi:hypothetical protein